MKRKLVMAVVLSMTLMAAGCSNNQSAGTESTAAAESTSEASSESSSETSTDGTAEAAAERPEYKALDYVTLGEYKGLEVTLVSTAVTDEEIDSEIASTISQSDKLETLEEGTVEEGDVVNIDYEGTKDGVAFDGGTDKGYDLTIGSNTFIDGFESGLVGKNVGESVDLDLTFPEGYQSEDLAGQDVVFHVTINSLKRAPEFTDELAAELSEDQYKTVDEYRANVESTLKEQKAATQDNQKINDLMTQVYSASTINDYPADVVEFDKQQYIDYYTDYAEQSEMTLAEFLEQNYQTTEDDFNTQIEQMVQQNLSQEMLLKAIVETENLEITEEEYQEGAAKYAEQYGFDDIAGLEAQYTKETVEQNLLLDEALQVVEDAAIVTDPEAGEVPAEDETADESESESESEAE